MELNNETSKLTTRMRLGRRLRKLREREGLSLRQLSEQVGGYSHSYLGRVELGDQLPSEALVSSLDAYFNTDGVLSELLELVHDSSIPDYGRVVVSREADAVRIQVFTSSLIPGLLQTKEYAWELFRASLPGESEDGLNKFVAVRMKRKGIFERDDPPFYWAIMDEAALRRPMKSAALMAAQLRHILEVTESRHLTVQVLPFSGGAHPMLGGCLTLLTLLDGGTMAFVESFKSGETVELPKRVVELTQGFDIARSLALPEDESLDLIRKYLGEYEDEQDS
ncbi:Scr1 family TA system antitoxin-like transcriptional regulator [Streptomyces sp. NPDC050509]|uniref:helix-turn-helix domain-containing protein n=1 Tax=Streptomyces sp. NPDC050509 TaxID=3365620 RepID=UPI00378B0D12